MKQTISEHMFVDAFKTWDTYKDNFSYEGLRALYQYLTDTEDDNNQIELDVVAICCEYTEYDSAWDAMEQYRPDDMPVEGEEGDDLLEIQEKNEKAAHKWLEEHTAVVDVEGGHVIIQEF